MSSGKHGWGSHYTGYGDNVHVNEAGALGVTSAHASEDSIELMVRGVQGACMLWRTYGPGINTREAGTGHQLQSVSGCGSSQAAGPPLCPV